MLCHSTIWTHFLFIQHYIMFVKGSTCCVYNLNSVSMLEQLELRCRSNLDSRQKLQRAWASTQAKSTRNCRRSFRWSLSRRAQIVGNATLAFGKFDPRVSDSDPRVWDTDPRVQALTSAFWRSDVRVFAWLATGCRQPVMFAYINPSSP